MKKFTLLTCMLFCLFTTVNLFALTVHISGTVTSDSTGSPIVNHEVTVFADSSNSSGFIYYTSVLTNANGIYEVNVPNVPDTGLVTEFHVRTFDCMNILHDTLVYSNNTPITVNFVICYSPPPGCEAHYVAYPDSSSGFMMHFYDTSTHTGDIISWLWNFGDPSSGTNNISTLQNPTHIFPAGTYTVCLTIYTNTSCTDTYCQGIEINGGGCHAQFVAYPDSAPHQLTVHFISTSTGNINSFLWNFGDPASGIMNTATTGDPWHTFTSAGTYNVCLTIHGDSCEDITCQEMTFGSEPPNCENSFSYTSNFLTVAFEGHTNSIYPTTYSWNMGDPASTNMTGKNVTFTYPAQGSYTVTLVTVDSTGCSWTRTQSIYVHGTCDINGTVYAGDHYVDHGFIQLIRIDSGSVMIVADSMEFGDSLGMYWFGLIGPGHYYLKAELTPASAFFGNFVPTYYEHAINWANANMIELGQPSNPYNIHLVPAGGENSGPGTIHGSITQGTKINGNGSPVPNVEVLLLDINNQPLGYIKTDNNGQFNFPDIALGSYKVYPEVTGKTTTPAIFTLDNSVPSVNLVFNITQNNVTYGINDGLSKYISGIGEVFPDPVIDKANIDITATKNINISLAVYNITGQMMKEIESGIQKGKNVLNFNRTGLNAGCYYLKIQTEDKSSVVKKFTVGK